MKRAIEQQQFNGRKCLGFGPPKGAGKTTFYLYMPQPILVFQFDLGSITVPPGVNPNEVYVHDYPDNEAVDLSANSLKRKRELGDKLAKDLVAFVNGFKSTTDIITLSDGTSCKKPASVLFDGGTRMDDILIDLICAINGISDPTDMPSKAGISGAGTQRFYSDRLTRIKKLFNMAISVPCNVGMSTWEDIKVKTDPKGNIVSRTIEPDLGGKLNILGPGSFDSCIYHYHDAGKYLVRTKPTPEISRLGVRGDYNLAPIIDVTIKDGSINPYERVFGNGKN